ncbi:MAG: DUF1054 family protein [Armatimonadetes bacterium]|nr:DUF1054 family protein [Armatimonadota bacterium]MDE2206213.1 DUF1054 family protein [Armatimonadota bacterium]
MSPAEPAATGNLSSGRLFEPEQFHVFAVEGFTRRMPLVRTRITPVLAGLAEPLCEPLAAVVEEPLFPHVARHMRRTVNPPEATWVAFGRSPRAYKPWIHIRVGMALEGVRVSVFVEDDAEDKPRFAANLRRNAAPLARWFRERHEVLAFDFATANGFSTAAALGAAGLRRFADRLLRVKAQHASFGVVLSPERACALDTGTFIATVCDTCQTLLPLYRCGAADSYRFSAQSGGSSDPD